MDSKSYYGSSSQGKSGGIEKTGSNIDWEKKLVVNKISTNVGSVTATTSTDFHRYRDNRRTERDRLAAIEEEAIKHRESVELIAKLAKNKEEAEERLKKNVLKRNRRKDAKKRRKLEDGNKAENSDHSKDSEDENDAE